MVKNPRCLYHSDFLSFLSQSTDSVFGMLCDSYHGDALTSTREAWKSEIEVVKGVLSALPDKTGQIKSLKAVESPQQKQGRLAQLV